MGLFSQDYNPDVPFDQDPAEGSGPAAPPPPPATGGGGPSHETHGGPIDPHMVPPVGGGGGHGGGGGADLGYLGALPQMNFGPVPQFNPDPFNAPSFDDVYKSPDYQTRLQTGEDALQHSAAARGVLHSGGTLKDILDYGKKFGQGEYDDSYNHAAQTYQLNYTGQHDKYTPLLAEWQTKAQAQAAAVLAQYAQQWDMYKFSHPNYGPVQAPIPPGPVYIPPYGG